MRDAGSGTTIAPVKRADDPVLSAEVSLAARSFGRREATAWPCG